MEIGTITSFLTFHGLGDTIAMRRGSLVMGAAPFDKAEKGDLSWSRNGADNFHGSLLLNDKYAMALVLQEFFPKKRPICVHPGTKIGDGTVIGGDGFGFAWSGSEYVRWPHIGGLRIDENVELGDNNTVDRGSLGDTIILKGVKTDNLVHIAHNCVIGENTLLAAGATLSGSVEIGERCFIGVGSTIAQKIKIGHGAVIGAGAVVVKDVPAGECWMGNPARYHKEASDVSKP